MYKMKEEYYTGITEIDEQHKKLFDIVDDIYELLKNEYIPDKYDHIIVLINELREYTATHFRDEEAYMEKVGHKRMFSQKIEHAEFLEKVNSIELSDIEENQEVVLLDLLSYLNDWFVSHILEKDMLIAIKEA